MIEWPSTTTPTPSASFANDVTIARWLVGARGGVYVLGIQAGDMSFLQRKIQLKWNSGSSETTHIDWRSSRIVRCGSLERSTEDDSRCQWLTMNPTMNPSKSKPAAIVCAR